ncbi:MAG: hypothetical protein B7Y99_11670 [Caulobacterales bacterium 32-69-10]|nr:MAG: hypothetical protein B7Y99_11670 [Caulobacterales bacterium 32-69-10]
MSAPDLDETAAEELDRALDLSWAALSKITPWGDTYVGLSTSGREVEIARNYIWAEQPGGDILVEVAVYAGETRYDDGAKVSRIIRKP